MIKINFEYDEDFKQRYWNCIATQSSIDKYVSLLKSCPPDVKKRLLNVFRPKKLKSLVLTAPNTLETVIDNVLFHLPELEEAFLPYLYFSKLKIDNSLISHKLTKKSDKKDFNNNLDLLIANLKQNYPESYKVSHLADCLMKETLTSDKKKLLKAFNTSISSPNSNVNLESFPEWLKNIDKLFDYSKLPKEITYELTRKLDIKVCPFCNEVRLPFGSNGTKKYRAALDHFYPKSKYPFLSLSLYNLIPTCTTCNSSLKKETSTKGSYLNPHVGGVNESSFFIIKPKDPLKVTYDKYDHSDFSIKLITNEKRLVANIDLFDLQKRYNEEKPLKIVKKYYRLKNMDFLEKATDEELKDIFDIDLEGTPKKEEFRKLKIDIFNKIFNKKMKTYS